MSSSSIEKQRAAALRYRRNIKKRCFEHYCGGAPRCLEPGCCETDVDKLELHHPDGGGNKDRSEKIGYGLRSCGGWHFYLKLKQLGYPAGYQVICTKCHDKKHGRPPREFRAYNCAPGVDQEHFDDVVPF